MNNKEILKKVIKKAVRNGWNKSSWEEKTDLLLPCSNNLSLLAFWYHYPILIFSHEFVKAFWGKDKRSKDVDIDYQLVINHMELWQYHLQEMVLEEEPLKYLEKFL